MCPTFLAVSQKSSMFLLAGKITAFRALAHLCARIKVSSGKSGVNSTIRSTLWAARTFAQDYPKIYTPGGIGNLKTCQLHFADKLCPRIFRLKAALHPPATLSRGHLLLYFDLYLRHRLEFTCGYIDVCSGPDLIWKVTS